MCFTLTLIKEIEIFKRVADENCANDDNGTRFDFLWSCMEGDTGNASSLSSTQTLLISCIFSTLSPGGLMCAFLSLCMYI